MKAGSVENESDAAVGAAVPALADPAIAGITRLSAVDTVRARMALAIQLGLLGAGEQVPPDADVAEAMGVSAITARRALKSLADDGVLVRRRGRAGGTFVADQARSALVDSVSAFRADTDEVHSLIDRRILLECALTHHAALSATSEQLDELDGYVREAAAAKNWTDYHAADEKLHLGVARAAGLPWAIPHYSEALNALYRYFIPYPVAYLRGVNQEHEELVAALRNRDPVAAVDIIERHVSTLHQSMFVGLETPTA